MFINKLQPRRGRRPNSTYNFATDYSRHSTHVMQIRSKQVSPELKGTSPQCPATYSNRTKANISHFALVLFL